MLNRADQLDRRAFLVTSTVASAAMFVNRASLAQMGKVPRVGVIVQVPGPYFDVVRDGLAQLGYVNGQNILLEPRFAEGQPARLPEFAAEMMSLNADVIVAIGAIAAIAVRRVTSTVPIVFVAVVDPVLSGFAATVERPGGNITGITSFDRDQPTKQLEMLKQVVPDLARVAFLSDEILTRPSRFERSFEAAAEAMGLEPQVLRVKGPDPDLAGSFSAMMSTKTQGLVVLEVPVTIQHQTRIAEMAAVHRLPALFPGGFSRAGGLISYGTTILDTLPHVSEYVDQILKGKSPGELPIRFAARRELIFNLQAARATGVTIPRALLDRADRIIE